MRKGLLPKGQSGFVLVLTLGFLIVLTILGLAAAGTTAMETLMARNFRDRDIAFAAAEVGLRDAELRLNGRYTTPPSPLEESAFPDRGTQSCKNGGLCDDTKNIIPEEDFFAADSKSQELGDWTTSVGKINDIVGLAAQPRHMIEKICDDTSGNKICGESGTKFIYRITVQAQGKMSSSRVILQEVYKK